MNALTTRQKVTYGVLAPIAIITASVKIIGEGINATSSLTPNLTKELLNTNNTFVERIDNGSDVIIESTRNMFMTKIETKDVMDRL
jgi:hypothetical protein